MVVYLTMKEPRNLKSSDAEENGHRERILGAAAELFLENGYQETSTADIARRAKVSKRELYSNFEDKRDILSAVITELQGEISAQANISWLSSDDLPKVLMQAGTHLLDFISSEKFGKLFRIVIAESFRDPGTAQQFYRQGPRLGLDDTTAFMRRQMKAGNLRNTNPAQAADDFLSLVLGSRHLTTVLLGQLDDGPRAKIHVQHAVDIFLRYYGVYAAREKPNAKMKNQSNRKAARQKKVLPRGGTRR
jgi:TetR/AcrR family transcriptional regulator, mexJK operon transcriptional repressor